MSKAAKRTLQGSIVVTILTIIGVHYAQKIESAVSLNRSLHALNPQSGAGQVVEHSQVADCRGMGLSFAGRGRGSGRVLTRRGVGESDEWGQGGRGSSPPSLPPSMSGRPRVRLDSSSEAPGTVWPRLVR